MIKTKFLAAALATTTLLTTVAAPAALAKGHQENEDRWEARHSWNARYQDLDQAMWALASIERAYQLNLMVGVGQGQFKPGATITRDQAIITAVRLMGLETQAKSEMNVPLHFIDANRIDSWAWGYVAVANEKGILPPMGDGMLRPQEGASRLWASVLLVKALGYDAEAQSKMNVQLSFNDAAEIPANLVGYVAAAVDHKLVTGYDDGSFRPNRLVTRAEMAALLGRSEGQESDQGQRTGEISGTVQAVDATAGTATVKGAKGTVTASLTTDAAIFVDGKTAQLSAVQVGMNVWIKLDANLNITLLDATTPTATTPAPSQGQTVTGTVSAVTLPQGNVLGIVTVQPAGGTTVTAPVAPAAPITIAGAAGTLAAVHVGDAVSEQIVSGIVTQLTDTTPATPASTTVQGKVLVLTAPNATTNTPGSVAILPDNSSTAVTYALPVTVTVSQNGTAKTFADIALASEVQLVLQQGAVTQILMQ